jgi:hypothetical protein
MDSRVLNEVIHSTISTGPSGRVHVWARQAMLTITLLQCMYVVLWSTHVDAKLLGRLVASAVEAFKRTSTLGFRPQGRLRKTSSASSGFSWSVDTDAAHGTEA